MKEGFWVSFWWDWIPEEGEARKEHVFSSQGQATKEVGNNGITWYLSPRRSSLILLNREILKSNNRRRLDKT